MSEGLPLRFALEVAPPKEDVQALHDGLDAYNREHAVPHGYAPLNVMLRDDAGHVAGGLLGGTYWGWLHVDILWLTAAARRQDLGQRMLALAEQEAARRGCRHVFLDTMSFQALPFYLKQGYTLWGELDDFPEGHKRYFLRKALG